MPKKNGIVKTFSFDVKIMEMLNELCEKEHRTKTNLIEVMIIERYSKEAKYGKTQNSD